MTVLPANRLTVLRAHRLTARLTMRLLQWRALTGIHLALVCRRPHLPAPLQTAGYSVTADFQGTRRHYYGTTAPVPLPADEPAQPTDRWLTLPALERLVSYDSPVSCTAPCAPPPIVFRRRPHLSDGPGSRPAPGRGDRPSPPHHRPRRADRPRPAPRRMPRPARHRRPRPLNRTSGPSPQGAATGRNCPRNQPP
jgi:hypothetical protein